MSMPASEPRRAFEVPDWQVLMIGGGSGTGKTVLAHQLARRLGVALTQVDDIRLALQRMTAPAEQPALHYFLSTPDVWDRPADELSDRLIQVGRVVSRALEAVIAHHLDTPYPLILEGDGIVPALAVQSTMLGFDASTVRALFLFEQAEDVILANMMERGRGFDQQHVTEQRTQARMAWLYGRWLRTEAERFGLPVVNAGPRETLLDRAIAAIA
jgi:2-phosphoglycerate kinase